MRTIIKRNLFLCLFLLIGFNLYSQIENCIASIEEDMPLKAINATNMAYESKNGVSFPIQGTFRDALPVQNSVTIQGSSLQRGMYLYSLIADGQEVDTKRMILTK